MKYTLILLALLPFIVSCKSKKNVVQANKPLMDTFYVMKVGMNEIEMYIQDENKDPNGSWTLQTIDGRNTDEMQRVQLELNTSSDDKTVTGNDGCNKYFGKLTAFNNKKMEFGPLGSTKRACMIPANYAKTLYDLLAKTRTYNATEKYLILKDQNGKSRLQFIRSAEK